MTKQLSKWSKAWTLSSVAVTLLILFIIAYSWSRTRDLIRGPELTVYPIDTSTLASPLIKLEGQVQRVAHLQLNDGKIFADADGHFQEEILLYPGYNKIKIEATDRFGRTVDQYLELAYKPK
jgi:hypothetical protein